MPSNADLLIVSSVAQWMHYVELGNLLAGTVGNLLTVFLLTSLKLFQGNQCAFYLIAECLSNTASLFVQFIDRMTQYPDGSDLADFSLSWCKIRMLLDQFSQLIPFGIIALTTFDQILSTSHRYSLRRLSTVSLGRRLLGLVSIAAIIHSCPSVFLLGIYPPIGCSTEDRKMIYYYFLFYYPILVGILPIFIASLFSLIAFRNVRHLIRRQIPIHRRRLDRQLTAMVFSRVLALDILYSPYVIYRVYTLKLILSGNYDVPFLIDQILQMTVIFLRNVNYAVRITVQSVRE